MKRKFPSCLTLLHNAFNLLLIFSKIREDDMQEYKLYAPNKLGERLGDVKLNWFLCGKRYYDNKSQSYILLVPKGVKFYCVENGKSYFVPTKEGIKLTIENKSLSPTTIGSAFMCDRVYGCKDSVICTCFKFFIDSRYLREIEFPEKCQLISYAKQHDTKIKEKFPKFPTRDQIDKLLEEYTCSTLCSYLYDTIIKYTSTKSTF